MSVAKREISRDDILPMAEFEAVRAAKSAEIRAVKSNRRVSVGPFTTFYFENYETMWWQVHEMLRTEGGGAEQVVDELEAYNPLVPKGRELVATFMIEIPDEVRRHRELSRLGYIEDKIALVVAGASIAAVPEQDVERTTPEGKTSSVHFLHFPMTDDQAAAFKTAGTEVQLRIDHPEYRHIAILPEEVRAALAADLD
ncbi:MAG: DUF3501 family protein [Minwuiales bacterium]|nr:DUF3501 family protein [Minwuiales bacterium]